jgi:ATP-dependent Lon protease
MTGQIGQVMQESMQAALTWVRSNADRLGVTEDFFANHDLHIHVPAGAIPKDGPSAGVTMATALVSLLTKQRITPLMAMTGEITLSGNVLPVGGIKEKVLAAKRAGVRDVILPAENKMNLQEDLSAEQLENLNVHFVKTIDEALAVSLPSVEQSTAAKMIPPTPPKDPKQDYQPTQPVKEPEPVHDRVLTQA